LQRGSRRHAVHGRIRKAVAGAATPNGADNGERQQARQQNVRPNQSVTTNRQVCGVTGVPGGKSRPSAACGQPTPNRCYAPAGRMG